MDTITKLFVFLALVAIVKCGSSENSWESNSSEDSWASADSASSWGTPAPTPAPPTPSNQTPNYLWGIFNEYFGQGYNVTKYSITNGHFVNYPVPAECGTPYAILSVNETSAMLVCGDLVSMSIVSLDLESLTLNYVQTMAFENYNGVTFSSTSFGYEEDTNTLYSTGYQQQAWGQYANASILTWDFDEQTFNIIPIQGVNVQGDYNSVGVYNGGTHMYFVSLYNNSQNSGGVPYIYIYYTNKASSQNASGVAIPNIQSSFSSLVQTGNSQVYGVMADQEGYVMVYQLSLNTGHSNLFYHTQNYLSSSFNPVLALNQYLVIISYPSSGNANLVTVLNTNNKQTKTYSLGALPTTSGTFFLATN